MSFVVADPNGTPNHHTLRPIHIDPNPQQAVYGQFYLYEYPD